MQLLHFHMSLSASKVLNQNSIICNDSINLGQLDELVDQHYELFS